MGEEGDLVCTKPFPCMPVYFWNDSDGAKYRKSYFSEHKSTPTLPCIILGLVDIARH